MKRLSPLQFLLMATLSCAATACTKEEPVGPNPTRSAIQLQQDEADPGCVFPLEPAASEAPFPADGM